MMASEALTPNVDGSKLPAMSRLRIGPALLPGLVGLVGLVGLEACLGARAYPCGADEQCVVDGVAGQCVQPGYCAYPDPECPSGLRFGESASNDLLDRCTPDEASSSSSDTGPASSSSDDDGRCDGPCDDPPGPCHTAAGTCDAATGTCEYMPVPAGTSCGGAGSCFAEGECDGSGTCMGSDPIACDDPPSDCHEAQGSCDTTTGGCVYAPKRSGSPCDDGDACTTGDACDDAGACTPGPTCPSDDPCSVGSCSAGRCSYEPLADGSSCGPAAADRCCGGACVDIASDAEHCGGCNTACSVGHTCESIEVTIECGAGNFPADTSGRCTCAGSDSQCPRDQVCRVVTPHPNFCTPDAADNCDGTFVDLELCPNHCGY